MKTILPTVLYITLSSTAFAQATVGTSDAYHLGVGSWTCERMVAALASKSNDIDRGQAAGWVLGFWSAVSVYEESDFVDKIESVGGTKILEATFNACQKEPASLVGVVSKRLVGNSRP